MGSRTLPMRLFKGLQETMHEPCFNMFTPEESILAKISLVLFSVSSVHCNFFFFTVAFCNAIGVDRCKQFLMLFEQDSP